MDDMGDYGYNKVQLEVMDYFISKNLPFTASIVANRIEIGSNLEVVEKIQEGIDDNLFEIGIHGYRHVDYSILSKEEQKTDFKKAFDKLEKLFGKRADIFFPPFNPFNLHTVEAMSELNISVLSTNEYDEQITTNPYNNQTLVAATNSTKLRVSSLGNETNPVYHVPFNISFLRFHDNGLFGDDLVYETLTLVDSDIAKQGFSQIRLHPTDFAKFDAKSGNFVNMVDDAKFKELTKTVDSLAHRNIRIASFTEIYPHSTIVFVRPVDYSFLFLIVITFLLVPYALSRLTFRRIVAYHHSQ